ncbi:MAG: histidinol-phosphate transaminase [Microcoleus sp. PH2017_29_MFU_D_A]|jgi:histidinol-phosphate aminotransferase|uniref:histidinol-phosphate transaminase n=1 Tax=unclassified Microcoleus TaxID=2642155 RepID=UPI001E07C10E|nr:MULTISPECIES: histidinol-phosphate transaminase [unclassified Microcoleus]MCC3419183.1 histidinol-phosphate transaminase [Microcoleus sp. PH2017_07_MST_O_A]MCC3429252.1 histidinol-phosphate transaminase [Microcoleus sp. PH2017_04_SCI_O_A]MCC3440506.1 histidinol-phosphate transaminase [Microcoleus sp. PH2017_03_ELD_O_A]MCC3465839.1 histidinol-phosphate transaminase [Microcoleus sp. PH2017_06_SFM_O_A]MCC3508499.1 histidinol-phosphate transaminase [Microcoleus sp. PH2017_17_BER_D_A]TAE13284.1
MLPFIRKDLAELTAYTPHPGGASGESAHSEIVLDRLDTNECPYDLPEELKQKLAWTYQQLIETNRYPDGGHAALKEAIAQYVNEGLNIPPLVKGDLLNVPPLNKGGLGGVPEPKTAITADNISVGNGSDELIRSLLIATCLGGAGSIFVANPTFSMYGITATTLGIPVVSARRREDNFAIDINAAKRAIDQNQNPPVRIVFVVHPNSPTANALTINEIEWLSSLPENILVVIDEAYFEFSQNTLADRLHQHPNWIILRTFSKAFRLASMRVGYAIAHPELTATLEKIRLPYNLPSFSQTAAEFALAQRQLLLAVIPETISERAKLIAALTQHQKLQVWPSAANFLYLRVKAAEGESAEQKHQQIMQQLKAQGTLIRHTGGGLRITVGTPDENVRTCDRLAAILTY